MNIAGILFGIFLIVIGLCGAVVNLVKDNNLNESPDFSGIITFGFLILAMGICI